MKQKTCIKCGRRFTSKRPAKYCSDSCRVGFHRHGNAIDQQLRAITAGIVALTDVQPELLQESHIDALRAAHRQFIAVADELKQKIEKE